jgi:hypothetical protein
MERNRTERRDYPYMADYMISDLRRGILPTPGYLDYMFGMSDAGRTQAQRVMDQIHADPQLDAQFGADVAAYKAQLPRS